ncbi:extracellular solute-binding protein [Paenibacillus sp. LHD-38]|uniref:extracellular solute-binding protein n=1 Tax=Paenibacillus sp. LHD-38 TaxID=3072143 RepID=UPI00280D629C|nr:extracellular solute-binding protein [Paenibacillus sp. LHD-38]MDQ8737894.1 extracellular solute-binding protein [Paenibacillus sp. LHD-38]
MKMRKVFSFLLTISLLGALLAGCSGGSGETKDGNTKEGDTPSKASTAKPSNGESDKPIKLEIIESGNNLPTPDKDIIKKELDKALNIDLNLTVYPSNDDYVNQLNVRMSSGNFPDLFMVSRQQLIQFSKQGLLLDITPYMDKLQQTVDYIGEDSVKKGMVDGKVYGISKSPQIPYNTLWIRKDWLDKLKLQVPTTIEQLKDVAEAFTTQDPDGNGKPDTFGLTGGKLFAFSPVFGAFGVGMPGNFYEKDGAVVNALYDPAMKDALTLIQQMIASGSVDPELLANSGLQHQEKAIKGQAGMVYIDWPNMTKEQFVEQIKTVNPNAEWLQMAAPSGPGGQFDGSWDIGAAPGRFAIPKALEKDPEKLQRVFDLLNYISNPEGGSMLVQFGVKDTHFTIDNGKPKMTDKAGDVGYSWLYQFTGRPEMEYLQAKFTLQSDAIKFANDQPRIKALNGFADNPEGFNSADADRYIEEEIAKFIYNKRPISEYDAFIKTLETSMNYKAFLDSAYEQLKALGYGG